MKQIVWFLIGVLIFCATAGTLAQAAISPEERRIRFLISELERTISILSQEPMNPFDATAGFLEKDKLISWFDLERPESQGVYYRVLGLPVPSGLKLNRTKSEFFRMNKKERENLKKTLQPVLADLRRKIAPTPTPIPTPTPTPTPTPPSLESLAGQLQSWQQFYHNVFRVNLDLSKLQIPEHRVGFDRLIVVAKGINNNRAYNECAKQFRCEYNTHDKGIESCVSDRVAAETYAIWVRDRVEADEENKNKSVNMLTSENHKGITLTERLILELKYFSETGKHLDIEGETLCSGSRYSCGCVPHVDWRVTGLNVHSRPPSFAVTCLRSRSVVF